MIIRKLLIFTFFFVGHVFADTYQCEKVFDDSLQVKKIPFCNSLKVGRLADTKVIGKINFNNLLLSNVLEKNNLGAVKVKFNHGHQKIVYRSAYLSGAPECINSLSKSNVRTVFNLYSGKLGYQHGMMVLESEIIEMNGIPNYIQINDYMVNSNKLSTKEMNHKITDIIKQIYLANSDVLIHCYTGEHDTGVIFGVLNKCINNVPLKLIDEETKCHMDYSSDYGKRTYKKEMDIIRKFPCNLILPNLF